MKQNIAKYAALFVTYLVFFSDIYWLEVIVAFFIGLAMFAYIPASIFFGLAVVYARQLRTKGIQAACQIIDKSIHEDRFLVFLTVTVYLITGHYLLSAGLVIISVVALVTQKLIKRQLASRAVPLLR